MPRPPRPDDLYRLRVATEPRVSPDGRWAVVTLQTVAPSYADRIETPVLIQHAERDIRTTVGQAEALFTVLRYYRRPVRLMRVPEETHELTRSGTPFRRVENLGIVLGWFRHFLVDGKTSMPPLPKVRGGR